MSRDNIGKIVTMFGVKEPEELGYTSPHEHLYFNTSGYKPDMTPEQAELYDKPVTLDNLYYVRTHPCAVLDNCLQFDKEVLRRALEEYKALGGQTICDVTPHGCGLDTVMPDFLPEIRGVIEDVGLNVVLGMGHYIDAFDIPEESKEAGASSGKNYDILMSPSEVIKDFTAEELADQYIRDIRTGYGDMKIKPGVIGELGTGNIITEVEKRTLRAGALAQQETGLAITLHMQPPAREDHIAIDVLEETGARLDKVVLGHRDGVLAHPDMTFDKAIDHYLSILERGCYIQFDLCGNQEYYRANVGSWWLPGDRERALAIKAICDHGFGDKILISTDIGHKYYMTEFGGWGYGHILNNFREFMLVAGLTEKQCDRITKNNPQEMLTIF